MVNTEKKQKTSEVKDRSRKINTQTGLYVKNKAVVDLLITQKGTSRRIVTKEELAKLAPTLKRLAEYDKKGSKD